jgi:hypothetical protein
MQGNGKKTGTDGDFFVTVDPRNWKRLKEEEEEKDESNDRNLFALISKYVANNFTLQFYGINYLFWLS